MQYGRLLTLLGSVVLAAGCSIPTRPVTTPLRLCDTFTVGGALRISVFECWDSTVFSQARYIPVFLFISGDQTPLYVAARQEYLGRFAGPLRPAQKELLRSVPQRHTTKDSTLEWRVPTYEGEVSDLQHTTPIRNLYWSIDRYNGTETEIAVLWLRSYPQIEPWDWRRRPPDFWQQLRQEASALYPELRRHVQRDLEKHVLHAPLAP
ncbi:MAG: hypothetical protein ABDH31_03135 [Chlorobiota bacterium]